MREVVDVIAKELDVARDTISGEVRLADLGADSLDRLGLAMRLEEAYGIVVSDDALAELRTIGDFVDLVDRGADESLPRAGAQDGKRSRATTIRRSVPVQHSP